MPGDRVGLCATCAAQIDHSHLTTCPRCAATVGLYSDTSEGCSSCRDERPHYDSTLRLGRYEGLLRTLILRAKHYSGEPVAELLGTSFARRHRNELVRLGVDRAVAVPSHWWRRMRRGYNQAQSIADSVARELGLPVSRRCLRRIRATAPQADLSRTDRQSNVRGAFAVRGNVAGESVLLIDDVMTTGSTIDECAKALKRAGAKRVIVGVLARPQ